jgi:hypothetical protein
MIAAGAKAVPWRGSLPAPSAAVAWLPVNTLSSTVSAEPASLMMAPAAPKKLAVLLLSVKVVCVSVSEAPNRLAMAPPPVMKPLAWLSVNVPWSTADSGSGSLRQAVLDANAHLGIDTIHFDDGMHGTITLTSGELDITDGLTIDGPGALNISRGRQTHRRHWWKRCCR